MLLDLHMGGEGVATSKVLGDLSSTWGRGGEGNEAAVLVTTVLTVLVNTELILEVVVVVVVEVTEVVVTDGTD